MKEKAEGPMRNKAGITAWIVVLGQISAVGGERSSKVEQ